MMPHAAVIGLVDSRALHTSKYEGWTCRTDILLITFHCSCLVMELATAEHATIASAAADTVLCRARRRCSRW